VLERWTFNYNLQFDHLTGEQDPGVVPTDPSDAEDSALRLADDLFLGEPGSDWDFTRYRAEITANLKVLPGLELDLTAAYKRDEKEAEGFFFGDLNGNELTRNPFLDFFERDIQFYRAALKGEYEVLGMNHRIQGGWDYNNNDIDGDFAFGASDTINILNPTFDGADFPSLGTFDKDADRGEFTNAAFFVHDLIDVGYGIKLLAGVRFHDFEDEQNPDLNTTEETPWFGLSYTPPAMEWLTLFGNYSESFIPNSATDAQFNTLPPQTGEQFEVGVKVLLFQDRVEASAAFFDITKENLPEPDPNNPNFSVASGEQTSQGVELQLRAQATPSTSILANYSFVDKDEADGPPSQAPENEFAVWVERDFPELRGLTAGAGVSFVDDRFSFSGVPLSSFTVVDARAVYAPPGANWDLQLNVKNLFDEEFLTSALDFPGFRSFQFGQQRAISLRLNYRF